MHILLVDAAWGDLFRLPCLGHSTIELRKTAQPPQIAQKWFMWNHTIASWTFGRKRVVWLNKNHSCKLRAHFFAVSTYEWFCDCTVVESAMCSGNSWRHDGRKGGGRTVSHHPRLTWGTDYLNIWVGLTPNARLQGVWPTHILTGPSDCQVWLCPGIDVWHLGTPPSQHWTRPRNAPVFEAQLSFWDVLAGERLVHLSGFSPQRWTQVQTEAHGSAALLWCNKEETSSLTDTESPCCLMQGCLWFRFLVESESSSAQEDSLWSGGVLVLSLVKVFTIDCSLGYAAVLNMLRKLLTFETLQTDPLWSELEKGRSLDLAAVWSRSLRFLGRPAYWPKTSKCITSNNFQNFSLIQFANNPLTWAIVHWKDFTMSLASENFSSRFLPQTRNPIKPLQNAPTE